ncbi:MAG: aldehyde dehydrogenase EutE [Ignavibacteriales bacterium]|nr:aldehyde dehydrogenase EutE [Ignavibacteriales bacterium]MCB9218129.1 aldehyde dehydrogenase EutE [Ignavibacteriales bacterium]
MSGIDRTYIENLVRSVVNEIDQKNSNRISFNYSSNGVYENVDEAIANSIIAQKKWVKVHTDTKKNIIEALRKTMHKFAEDFSLKALTETGMGRLEDKIAKHHNAADSTPGMEDLETRSWNGSKGTVIEERAPYGVIAGITPSTHPIPVLLNSIIITIAGGNSVVFSVHPAAKKVSAYAIEIFHKVIIENGGPENLITMIKEPTLENVNKLFNHKDIDLIVATGGPAVVEAAFKAGKKVVAAGPGNPPVLVDETADLNVAAKSIITGASFDNNILCIAEKETFVVHQIFDDFIESMVNNGAVLLNAQQIEMLTQKALMLNDKGHYLGTKDYIGKNARILAEACGVNLGDNVRLLFGEVSANHPFVIAEQMMPFMPVVRVNNFEVGVMQSKKAEHGFGHTAVIHSRNLDNITQFTKEMNTSIVIVNGPSLAGNGPSAGEGYFSHTIASPTGEGVCTPRDFTRVRRLAISNSLKIV